MAFGNGSPRGWPAPDTGLLPGDLPEYQPQMIGAGAFEPLSSNVHLYTTPQEFTGADSIVFTCIEFEDGTILSPKIECVNCMQLDKCLFTLANKL